MTKKERIVIQNEAERSDPDKYRGTLPNVCIGDEFHRFALNDKKEEVISALNDKIEGVGTSEGKNKMKDEK